MRSLLIALIVALGLTGWGLYREIQSGAVKSERIEALSEAAEQVTKQRLKDRKVLVARASEIASKRRELARVQGELDAALAHNPDWAAQPVPQDIQKALTDDGI